MVCGISPLFGSRSVRDRQVRCVLVSLMSCRLSSLFCDIQITFRIGWMVLTKILTSLSGLRDSFIVVADNIAIAERSPPPWKHFDNAMCSQR